MPKITAISPQKKKIGRFNIFLDDKFAFGIEAEILLSNNFKIGQVLQEEEIARIIKSEQGTKLLDLATNFLSYRPRSEREMGDYLAKKISAKEGIKFQEARQSEQIEKIIFKLKKYKYLDDKQFAQWFVTSRTSSRPKGAALIKLELRKKGIDREIIDEIFHNAPGETNLAKRAVERKLRGWENLTTMDFKKKFYSYLASKGFDFETIKETFAFYSKKR
ncbi:MAG: RecX family transcriptional regulator [Candidatus Curtissbacteria bacterium]